MGAGDWKEGTIVLWLSQQTGDVLINNRDNVYHGTILETVESSAGWLDVRSGRLQAVHSEFSQLQLYSHRPVPT